jgi:acyl-CoA reductase-like NAD-dependent aldehyde dehydrogenase
MTFRTPEEAVEPANNIHYGLNAGVWTDNMNMIFRMVNKLRAGVMWGTFKPSLTRPVRSAATKRAALASVKPPA